MTEKDSPPKKSKVEEEEVKTRPNHVETKYGVEQKMESLPTREEKRQSPSEADLYKHRLMS